MGYTTDFEGFVTITPPLNAFEHEYLLKLGETRRMARTKGPLYVEGTGYAGQGHDDDITSFNDSGEAPGLWLQWVPQRVRWHDQPGGTYSVIADDAPREAGEGSVLVWNGAEKFYSSAEWMEFLRVKLLAPEARAYLDLHQDEDWRLEHFTCDHVLTGMVAAQGEESEDTWALVVEGGSVMVALGARDTPEQDADPDDEDYDWELEFQGPVTYGAAHAVVLP
jgi:hypothetical protein